MTFIERYQAQCGDKGERPLGWLQQLADATGVTIEAVYQWGKGFRVPNASAQRIIADTLGATIEELFPTLKTKEK